MASKDDISGLIAETTRDMDKRSAAKRARMEEERAFLNRTKTIFGVYSGVLAVALVTAYAKMGFRNVNTIYVAVGGGFLFLLGFVVYRWLSTRVTYKE